MTDSWKVSLPCTRLEAETLKEDMPALAMLSQPPVLMTSEADPTKPDRWRLDAYFDAEPAADELALLQTLVPSAAGTAPLIERLTEQDWVSLSQEGLEPIVAGRFFVHTPAYRHAVPADAATLEIDAGRAFGTGHHETTVGCLRTLDTLARRGGHFSDILDLGTGTGLLAFAAHRLWPAARVAASDIDPIAVEVARRNAAINRIRIGRARGQVELAVAVGLDHARLRARAPYDLILANILAGPLVDLAPAVAAALAPGGTLILAGLLDHQADAVAAAYRRQGLMAVSSVIEGEWPSLQMRKRKRIALRSGARKRP